MFPAAVLPNPDWTAHNRGRRIAAISTELAGSFPSRGVLHRVPIEQYKALTHTHDGLRLLQHRSWQCCRITAHVLASVYVFRNRYAHATTSQSCCYSAKSAAVIVFSVTQALLTVTLRATVVKDQAAHTVLRYTACGEEEMKVRRRRNSTTATRKMIEPCRWRRKGSLQRVADRASGRAPQYSAAGGWEIYERKEMMKRREVPRMLLQHEGPRQPRRRCYR